MPDKDGYFDERVAATYDADSADMFGSKVLRAKPGGQDIGVTIGDFATTSVGGSFSLAYLVFYTIGNLTTQEEQVACFRNMASHLEPGGCFVIEVRHSFGMRLRERWGAWQQEPFTSESPKHVSVWEKAAI